MLTPPRLGSLICAILTYIHGLYIVLYIHACMKATYTCIMVVLCVHTELVCGVLTCSTVHFIRSIRTVLIVVTDVGERAANCLVWTLKFILPTLNCRYIIHSLYVHLSKQPLIIHHDTLIRVNLRRGFVCVCVSVTAILAPQAMGRPKSYVYQQF